MKDEVLKRGMFSQPLSKSSRNSGIMAGFEDEVEEDAQPMARSPQNPEILMNNLRGDMRSVDARYLELAQMVGEEAAMETPPEVLAMLQSQLAAQEAPPMPQGGIGALPQGTEMAPPPMMEQGQGMAPPMMPPGMEGMPPFPQGGAEQAPPTPDGMPPLRAAEGKFVTNEARMNQPFYMPDMGRALALTGGEVPPDQMSPQEAEWLRTYQSGMGFTGGGIRDAAKAGVSRISSALSPYVAKGKEFLNTADEFIGGFLPQGMRVAPYAPKGRVVAQGRENIVQGPSGPVMGQGTRLEAANTLEMGSLPFTEAFKRSSAGQLAAKYPKTVGGAAAGTSAAALLANMPGDPSAPPRSAADIAASQAVIDQIPGQGPPPGMPPSGMPFSGVDESTFTNVMNEQEVGLDTPFNKPPIIIGQRQGAAPVVAEEADDITSFIKKKLKEEGAGKTRGERIKEEYGALEPTFRELLGDTKSDARTNALLLLADAGFKLASTYKPTLAMAIGEAFSGVPRGFAAIVAQAKDRDIKIKTGVLQQAVENVNLQDKYARDFQLEALKVDGRVMVDLGRAKNAQELEAIRAKNAVQLEAYKGDKELLLEQIRSGGVVEKDGGMGLTIQETKGGSFIGSYIRPDKDGNLPAPVRTAIDSRWTLRDTDNPFVENRGPAPTTVETDKGERVKLGTSLRSLDDSLRSLDDLRGQYAQLYSPGTWFTEKINNIIVPISGGMVRPDVDQAAAAARINVGLNQVMKRLASANDQGRVAVQEQEWAREMLNGLTDPTAFFSTKEVAAKQFAAMEAQLRNARQQLLTQLGYVDKDYSMSVPSTGTQVDPFVVPADPEAQTRMFRYLGSTIGTLQDPKATVYLRMPNGRVDAFNPIQLRGLVQK